MGHIFISYSHNDKDYAYKLVNDLNARGFNAWVDDRIDYGTKWPKVIQEQLDTCEAFIVVISENSYASEWVQSEVARAQRKGKPIFPLLLSGDTWLSIESTQYVDVTDRSLPPEKFYERLGLSTGTADVPPEPPQPEPDVKRTPPSRGCEFELGRMVRVAAFFVLLLSCVAASSYPRIMASLAPATSSPAPTRPIEVSNPTTSPVPSEVSPPTEPPSTSAFFTEEFDTSLSGDWSPYIIYGETEADPDKISVEVEAGKLVWSLGSKYVYYYLFYGAFEFEDVRLEVRAENRGESNSSVSLVCRYDPQVGWYEFNISNNGLYDILYAEVSENGKIIYQRLANGDTRHVKPGQAVNEYSGTCEGNELSLNVNGTHVASLKENKYGLRSGQVGISVSSFDALPVLIEMDGLKLSEP